MNNNYRSNEDWIVTNLDNGRNKEKLHLRAREKVPGEKLLCLYDSILGNKDCNVTLGLPGEEVHATKASIKRKYAKSVEDFTEEQWETFEQEQQHIIDRYLSRNAEHGYTRTKNFVPNPSAEERFLNEKLPKMHGEPTIINRVLEMMYTDLIVGYSQEQHPEYTFKGYKTTLYDDMMSGTDLIITWKDNGKTNYLAVDTLTGVSDTSLDKKSERSSTRCFEFGAAIPQRIFHMHKVVRGTSGAGAFSLLARYLDTIASGELPSPASVYSQYLSLESQTKQTTHESLAETLGGKSVDKETKIVTTYYEAGLDAVINGTRTAA